MRSSNTANYSPVDWSEFHVWTPSGVYNAIQKDRNTGPVLQPVAFNSVPSSGIAVWAHTLETKLQNAARWRPRFRSKDGENTQQTKAAKLAYVAYVQFAAGAVGGYHALKVQG